MKLATFVVFLCLKGATATSLLRLGASEKSLMQEEERTFLGRANDDDDDDDRHHNGELPPWKNMGAPIVMKEEGMGTYVGKINLSPDGKTFAMGTYLEDAKVSHGIAAYGVATYTYVDKAGRWIPLDDPVRVNLPVQGEGGDFDMAMSDRYLAISKVGYNVSGADEVHVYVLLPTPEQTRWYEIMPPILNDLDENKDEVGFGRSVAVAETKKDLIVAVGIVGSGGPNPPNARIQVYKAVFPEDFDEEPYWDKVGQSIPGNSDYAFGNTMKLSQDGKTLAGCDVKAESDEEGVRRHVLRVFEFSDQEKQWVPKGQDIEEKSTDDSFLCRNVDLSADGSTITSGVRFTSYDDATPQGHVRVWSYDESKGKWAQKGEDIDSLTASYYTKEAFAAEKSRVTFGKQLALSKNGTRLAVAVELVYVRRSSSQIGSFFKQTSILTFDWNSNTTEWVQAADDIAMQFGLESAAISDDGKVIAAATTDVYRQNVAQAFQYNPEEESDMMMVNPIYTAATKQRN